jgi:4-amino-4-deoxy-L-arabinose transferase-like glycosyltransferase
MRSAILSAALVSLAIFLLFWRLDGALLWRDEADTADLARLMVKSHHWVPQYFDGSELLAHLPDGTDFNSRFQPAIQGWLQYYVAAAAFQLFGVSTWTARFLFAFMGLLALAVLWRIGRILFGEGPISLLPPLFALVSIEFLTMFRECRYYALTYLLSALVIYELVRTEIPPDAEPPRQPVSFRLMAWGALLYFSHPLTFAGVWLAVGTFLLLRRDGGSVRRFVVMSAIVGSVILADCLAFERFKHVPVAPSAAWGWILRRQAKTIFGAVPVVLLACALFALIRRGLVTRRFNFAVQLCATLAIVPVAVSIALTKQNAGPHYYVSILPAAAILASIVVVLLWGHSGWRIAAAAAVALLVWPNLGFYLEYNERIAEREILCIHTFDDALIDFLRHNAHPNESFLVHRNMEGQVIHFYLPELRWVGLLESTDQNAAKLRSRLPSWCFDDRVSPDWLVIWHSVWEHEQTLPPGSLAGYTQVWDYTFYHPLSLWDRLISAARNIPTPVERYVVYRRRSPQTGEKRTTGAHGTVIAAG